jgi:hypothetical protein
VGNCQYISFVVNGLNKVEIILCCFMATACTLEALYSVHDVMQANNNIEKRYLIYINKMI